MTDTSMIERVARVLEPQAWAVLGIGDTLAYKNRRTSSLRKARAALQAMREPTEAMRRAGASAGSDLEYLPHDGDPYFAMECSTGLYSPEAHVCWQAMIDTAIGTDTVTTCPHCNRPAAGVTACGIGGCPLGGDL